MRYSSKEGAPFSKGDMTPMIDMTFQLIAFFMVLVNFSEADQNEKIRLPLSTLAKPPEEEVTTNITLQLTSNDTVILAGHEISREELAARLLVEKQVLVAGAGTALKNTTIVIRADREAKSGEVQEMIQVCQETGFEKFALRAQQVAPSPQ